jgi:N-methylhydantoinase A
LGSGADARSRIVTALSVDMRYRGQSYEIEVALTPRFVADFHAAHHRMFGYSAPQTSVEVVNLRVRSIAAEASPPLERLARPPTKRARAAPIEHARALVDSRVRRVPIFDRDALAGATSRSPLRGPMIIVELSATAYIGPDWNLRIDHYGNIHLEMR